MTDLAANAAATEPGWGKLVALLAAVGIFWVGTQVHKRMKAVKDGTEINPFSSDATQGDQSEKSQASTPSDSDETAPRKGLGKWFRKG